ncbi:serine/threonine-protein kinase LATS2-like isoform X1 [Leucoraja erinacea]|uniref:serine/threonine-protein kinase LATS2-like isoform X1 n=1 Tax=Leucoraja erinaceus TaxID=7782 RepID=UPI002455FBB5|nr:serine/threonine-protein kinase LATS2-like isoform X1 [Leucoraja erinacea]
MARAGGLPARRVRITWIPACPPAWPMRTVSVRGQAVGLPAPPMRRVSSDQAPSPGRSHGRPRPPSPAAPGLPGRSMAAAAEAEHRTPSASVKMWKGEGAKAFNLAHWCWIAPLCYTCQQYKTLTSVHSAERISNDWGCGIYWI